MFMLIPRSVWLHVASEVDFLRAELSDTREQLVRVVRKANDMPELPLEKRKQAEPLPMEVQAVCDGWATPHGRQAAMRRARVLYETHKDWSKVLAHMEPTEVE